MYKCKHCGKEFEDRYKLTGHSTHCKMNPNYENNRLKVTQNVNKRKEKHLKKDVEFICHFCGKKVGNKGCLVIHEKSCFNNPNRILSKKEIRRINKKPRKWSEDDKKRISISRKKWLSENKDKHVWKRNNKFISQPCENVKKFLRDRSISFVEEYTPFNDFNYSVDIAFPNKKIAIEINGNQHYSKNGELKEYYLKRHSIFEERGWNVYEIHYSLCFDTTNNFYKDLLKMDIFNDDYNSFVKDYMNKKIEKEEKIKKIKKEKEEEKIKKYLERRNIIKEIIKESNIDFSKYGWSSKLKALLIEKDALYDKCIFRLLKRYYKDFFKENKVFLRKNL